MRQETLRWGILMGLIAAIIGTVLFALGVLIAPLRLETSPEAVAFAYFTRGMLGFIALGVALGLAYYAGLRSERDMRRERATQMASGETGAPATQAAATAPWGERWNAPNTGAIVMLCYWIASTVCAYVFPLTQPGVPQPQNQALTNAELHLILLVVYTLFGAGIGGIGGRSYTSRLVLDRIIVMPPSFPSAKATEVRAADTPPPADEKVAGKDEGTVPEPSRASGDV